MTEADISMTEPTISTPGYVSAPDTSAAPDPSLAPAGATSPPPAGPPTLVLSGATLALIAKVAVADPLVAQRLEGLLEGSGWELGNYQLQLAGQIVAPLTPALAPS